MNNPSHRQLNKLLEIHLSKQEPFLVAISRTLLNKLIFRFEKLKIHFRQSMYIRESANVSQVACHE
ncbi:Uncharacterised protein [Streptococcus pneumoniae]|nr:Uncharacterised protein [Streptococcus pneumoniae]